jgi:hypothetical protein
VVYLENVFHLIIIHVHFKTTYKHKIGKVI